jgi:hypothetical protein
MDFDGLSRRLLSSAPSLLEAWFPAGKTRGREFLIGDLDGSPGESLSINVETGKWCDFANPDLRGGDLISLFAAKQGVGQGEAARQLSSETGYELSTTSSRSAPAPREPKVEEDWGYQPVSGDIPVDLNGYAGVWAYRLPGGLIACYVVRENHSRGPSTTSTRSWRTPTSPSSWSRARRQPTPRRSSWVTATS